MRSKYTLFLTGTLAASTNQTIAFQYDLRTLIPVSKRGKKFILYSAFDTGDQGVSIHAALQVGINFHIPDNKSSPEQAFTTIGIAQPVIVSQPGGGAIRFKYSYSETSYLGKMIQYPEVNEIDVNIQSIMGVNTTVGPFQLYLTFEEVDE